MAVVLRVPLLGEVLGRRTLFGAVYEERGTYLVRIRPLQSWVFEAYRNYRREREKRYKTLACADNEAGPLF